MYLASCELMGKLHLTSEMTEKEVAGEIRCVFKVPMNNNPEFLSNTCKLLEVVQSF